MTVQCCFGGVFAKDLYLAAPEGKKKREAEKKKKKTREKYLYSESCSKMWWGDLDGKKVSMLKKKRNTICGGKQNPNPVK